MYEYSIEHSRKNQHILQDHMMDKAKAGWKLHSMFEQVGGFMMIWERSIVVPMTIEEPITFETTAKPRTKKTVAFVKAVDNAS
jgi:hypothetical protein